MFEKSQSFSDSESYQNNKKPYLSPTGSRTVNFWTPLLYSHQSLWKIFLKMVQETISQDRYQTLSSHPNTLVQYRMTLVQDKVGHA